MSCMRVGFRSTPYISIEDGLSEDDWEGWRAMRERLGAVGATGGRRPAGDEHRRASIAASEEQASNAVLLKLNQIGTLTETRQALDTARAAGWGAVMSHRSGETEDTTIADLCCRLGCAPDKDGRPGAVGAGGQVQPAAADRGRAG